jgi:chromosome segregation ATPase
VSESRSPLPDPLYSALSTRLRDVLTDELATEAKLRSRSEEADAGIRALEAQIRGSERRLRDLSADSDSSLTEIASELRRVETLRPELVELTSLQTELDRRARELRTEWLLRQTRSARPST